jgi:hypothetical protein
VPTHKKKIAKIDEFLNEIPIIASEGYPKGILNYYQLVAKIKAFLRATYPDYKARIRESITDLNYLGKTDDDNSKLKFMAMLVQLKIHLEAYKEEIGFQDEESQATPELEKVRKKIEKSQLESKRRETVAESKFYGAVIELIDRMREELINKSKLHEEIKEVKTEIKEIKNLLSKSKK